MSCNARRGLRANRRLCACGRRALYHRPGGHGVSYRPDHPLCKACWGRLRDHMLAEQVARRGVVIARRPEGFREAA